MKREQQGVTMLVVLVLLSVMLLGGLALARMTEVGTLASGNAGYREASLQASEVGLNDAFAAVLAIPDEEKNIGGWYWNTPQAADSDGVPTVDWNAAQSSADVGPYQVRYIVERICDTPPVSDHLRQCLVRQQPSMKPQSKAGGEKLDPVSARQFRITVRVKSQSTRTETWIQALVTKG